MTIVDSGLKGLIVSESVSYLGLTLSSRGKFPQTQNNLADRRLKAVYKLLKDTHHMYDGSFFVMKPCPTLARIRAGVIKPCQLA